MKLTLELENEIELFKKYQLTPNELFFIRVLLILQEDDNEDLFSDFASTGINIRDIIISLQEKGIVLQSYKIPNSGEIFDPYMIPINKNFVKGLYKASFELGKELFDNYPQFNQINGTIVSLRGVSKFFNSLEDAYFRYGKCIRWNKEIHDEIIELVNWGKEHNIIVQSLGSFIVNNAWLDLKAMRDGENGININYDSIKLL